MCAPEKHEFGEELKRLEDGEENEGNNQRMGRGCRDPKRPVSSDDKGKERAVTVSAKSSSQ